MILLLVLVIAVIVILYAIACHVKNKQNVDEYDSSYSGGIDLSRCVAYCKYNDCTVVCR